MKRVGQRQNLELVNITGLIRTFRTNNKHFVGLPGASGLFFIHMCAATPHLADL